MDVPDPTGQPWTHRVLAPPAGVRCGRGRRNRCFHSNIEHCLFPSVAANRHRGAARVLIMRFGVLPGRDRSDCNAGVSAALLMLGVAAWASGHSNGRNNKRAVLIVCATAGSCARGLNAPLARGVTPSDHPILVGMASPPNQPPHYPTIIPCFDSDEQRLIVGPHAPAMCSPSCRSWTPPPTAYLCS
jgi:hypothetical protein